jgi:DNA-binding response OmpR family regulator
MPGLDGSGTARQLRQKGYTMPIVVLSANAYPSDRLNAINAGCNDFLSKPIQVSELLGKLKLHLALNWQYQEVEPELPSTHQLPPSATILELTGFVRIGDLLGLNRRLSELTLNQPEYNQFAQCIMKLAGEFRLVEIKKLLHTASEELASNDE